MKRLFLFIALFATVWEMKAQSIGAPFRWETTLGLNVSDLGGLGSRTGFHIGARFEIPIFAMNENDIYKCRNNFVFKRLFSRS